MMRLGRSSTSEPEPVTAPEAPVAGKGRPTPKRSDARSRRRTPAPTNRKEAAALQRQRAREARQSQRRGLMSGDERFLPARDAGPGKRLARDLIDARFTYGQVFFGLIFVTVALSVVNSPALHAGANIVALAALVLMFSDSLRQGRRAKAAVTSRYGEDEAKGVTSYALMRAMLPRWARRPPAKVKRGQPV